MSSAARPFLIVNPASANGNTGRHFDRIARAVAHAMGYFRCAFTRRRGEASDLAREAVRDGERLVVAVGGDGTASEVIDGLLEDGRLRAPELVFGCIPRGTGGDLRRTLGWPEDPGAAARTVAAGTLVVCDLDAQCGSCSVKINGRPMLACELLVENAVEHFGTTTFFIEPITVAPVVRDLIVDLEKACERVHRVRPYMIRPAPNPNPGGEYKISPRVLERYVEATRCVNCFCCATVCISSHKGFLGPNAVLASAVRIMDPREDATPERLKLLSSDEGVYRCHTSKACSHVCPKDIDVAHFIGLAKEGDFSRPATPSPEGGRK